MVDPSKHGPEPLVFRSEKAEFMSRDVMTYITFYLKEEAAVLRFGMVRWDDHVSCLKGEKYHARN